jgi:hypothetical protein
LIIAFTGGNNENTENYKNGTESNFGMFLVDADGARSSTASVLTDQDEDDSSNYGVRGNRITSNCVINGKVLVIPQVPPPATIADPTKERCLLSYPLYPFEHSFETTSLSSFLVSCIFIGLAEDKTSQVSVLRWHNGCLVL